jgi:hypothetical protein
MHCSEEESWTGKTGSVIPIEGFHVVAACYAFMPFHAYEQYRQDASITHLDFTKEITYTGLLNLYTLVRCPIPDQFTQNWTFKPIFGKSGYAYTFINLEQESLIGVLGYDKSNKCIIISFRGSQCLSDWCNNITFSQMRVAGINEEILLHGGYMSIFDNLKQDLSNKLTEISLTLDEDEKSTLSILLTGHSLGGAVASVTVPFIKKLFPASLIRLITFGAPKVGKQDYNGWLRKNDIEVTSFIRKTDPAPYAPASLRNSMLGSVIYLHHFYHFLWPQVHDMRYYLKAILNLYNQNKPSEEQIRYYDFYHLLLPGGIKV